MSTIKHISLAYRIKKAEARQARNVKARIDAYQAFVQQLEMGAVKIPKSKFEVVAERTAEGNRHHERGHPRLAYKYVKPVKITQVRRIEPASKYKPHVGKKQRQRYAEEFRAAAG